MCLDFPVLGKIMTICWNHHFLVRNRSLHMSLFFRENIDETVRSSRVFSFFQLFLMTFVHQQVLSKSGIKLKSIIMIGEILSSLSIDEDVACYIESLLENDPTDIESVALFLESMDIDPEPVLAQIKPLLAEPTVHNSDVDVGQIKILCEKIVMGELVADATTDVHVSPKDELIRCPETTLDNSEVIDAVESTIISMQDADELALQAALDDTDDFASAWQECKDTGRAWGGRGFGGRGVARQYQCASKGFTRDVKIDGVTLAFAGKELLTRTKFSLVAGHRYALLGRNGVGKSTLIRRIAAGALPGFPPHLTVSYLAQEPPAPAGEAALRSSLDALLIGACRKRRALLESEREELERALGEGAAEGYDEAAIVQRLGEVDDELEELSLSNGKAQDNCHNMLKELGFDTRRMNAAVGTLSGGWRMRVELAAALIAHTDILLLDEPTNHLDLKGVLWLEGKLTNPGKSPAPTVMVVSHDRAFVAAIATDIIVMEHQNLRYFDGGLEAFEQREEEAAAAYEHRLDARVRQETSARDAAAKMKQKAQKSGNDNAMRAAKQRLAKVERVGLYRDDGKRFKTRSLAKLDEKYSLLPSRVEAKMNAKQDVFSFPEPQAFPADRPLVSLDMVSLVRGDREILKSVNAFLYPGTRAAIVGDNGAG
jgi:ATPase subunit of ABC transporter with duplicated ATPase domains